MREILKSIIFILINIVVYIAYKISMVTRGKIVILQEFEIIAIFFVLFPFFNCNPKIKQRRETFQS